MGELEANLSYRETCTLDERRASIVKPGLKVETSAIMRMGTPDLERLAPEVRKTWNIEVAVAQVRRKYKDAPNLGHPAFVARAAWKRRSFDPLRFATVAQDDSFVFLT